MRRVVVKEKEEALDETAEEVERILVENLDELFDVVIVPRYGKATKDGVTLGPTWWAERIGMTPNAVTKRVQRCRSERQSQKPSTLPIRRAKSDLRKPGVVGEVMKDPGVREAVEEELSRQERRRLDRSEQFGREMRKRHPEIDRAEEKTHFDAGMLAVNWAADRLRDAVEHFQQAAMTDVQRAALSTELEVVRVPLTFLESFASADGSLASEIAAYLEAM